MSCAFYEGRRFKMRNTENDLRYRRRNSVRPFKKTREGPLTNRYRAILTFFMIGCLATFLIAGGKDVYGAGISIPVRIDYGSVPVGGTSVKSFDITNTGKDSFTILGVPKWAPPNYGWWTLLSDGCSDKSLSKGQSCTLTYSFSPPAVRNYDYTLNIPYTYDGKTINNANTHFYGTGIKGTPIVSVWPTASGITYGQALSASTLTGGSASVLGTFAFTSPTTVPNAGTYNASITFTPNDLSNYNTVTGSVNVAVAKATPSVTTWPTASVGITYGQPLSASTLSGGSASVPGTFAFTDPSYTPNAGTYNASITFTPIDLSNYNTITGSISVVVAKATPVITWANPAAIVYGTALSGTQLNATASVLGEFVYTPAAGTVLGFGTQTLSVTFTPNDTANYNNASATVQLTVNKATPTIAWNNPADITHPTPLTTIQLNATANVLGTFNYNPPLCTVLDEGNGQPLSVEFISSDPNYGAATATVTINVLAPYVTKDQIFDSWVCTERDRVSGLPIAMYLCTGSDGSALDCSSCITPGNRCAELPLADVSIDTGTLQWAGPGSSKNVDFVTSTTIYRCIEGLDLVFECGVTWTSNCNGSAPNPLDIPTVTTTTIDKIGNVWVCSGTDAQSGCVTDIYSCPGAMDTNPCICTDPLNWYSLTPSQVSFAAGELEWAGTGSGNANCQIVYFVTKKIVDNESCIYICISDTVAETEICYSNCAP